MDLSFFYQLRSKQSWWIDGLFYLSVSLFLAALLAYGVFLLKTSFTNQAVDDMNLQLQQVGTNQQKEQEQSVLGYQKRINDFAKLFKNHTFASNVFSFIQDNALPNVWFQQFQFDQKTTSVQLSGETETNDDLSRQVDRLEKNEYVQKVTLLNSKVSQGGKTAFNINLQLDESILQYSAAVIPLTVDANSPSQPAIETTPPASSGGVTQ